MRPAVSLGVAVVVAACAPQPKHIDVRNSIVALRPYGGAWQVLTTGCGQRLPIPIGQAYELVIVDYDASVPSRVNVTALQAGANDPSPTIDCPMTDDPTDGTVQLIGEPDALFTGFGQGAYVMAPSSEMLLGPGPSDLVAFAPADPPQQYLIERAATRTTDGIALDFAAQGQPVEVRPISFQGQAPETVSIDFRIEITTAGGLVDSSGPSRGGVPTSFWMIPISGLVNGDQETVKAAVTDGLDNTHGRSSDVDLRTAPAGPVTVVFPPPIEAATVTRNADGIDVAASTTWSFNEHRAAVTVMANDELVQSWSFTTLPGWPDAAFHVAGLTEIPGWQSWRPPPGVWGVSVCDHQVVTRECARLWQQVN